MQILTDRRSFFQSLRILGKISAEYHPFWTTQHPMGRMSWAAPDLFQQLSAADLTIVKGDLNYRKLTYDAYPVDRTMPFREAIGPLAKPETGLRILSLRTSKADVCVGLPSGVEDKLEEDWAWTGKYGVASFCDPSL